MVLFHQRCWSVSKESQSDDSLINKPILNINPWSFCAKHKRIHFSKIEFNIWSGSNSDQGSLAADGEEREDEWWEEGAAVCQGPGVLRGAAGPRARVGVGVETVSSTTTERGTERLGRRPRK